jgi:hypothetical protein
MSGGSLRRCAALCTIAAGCSIAGVPPLSAQDPTLPDVLSRLDAYLVRYETQVAAVVADEHYEQRLELASGGAVLARVLRSEYALARAPGGQTWTGYRDTYEVDGRPVGDREQRLLALLADGAPDGPRQAMRITRENARFNLGEEIVRRTINVPTIALDLIHPRHRSRLSFTRRGDAVIDGRRLWALAFEERGRNTIIRTPRGGDRAARGGVWIDPQTGEVLRTDLSWSGGPPGFVSVRYRLEANVGALVPETMTEEYRTGKGTIAGRATYTNYRRFQTGARIVP